MRADGLTTEQLISKCKVSLMNDNNWRWMAGILMMGTTSVTDNEDMPTARTDGLNEEYNRSWMGALSIEEAKFIILHENFHKMFRHLYVWQKLYKENKILANIACDIVINTQYLNGQPGIKFVENGTIIPKYADKDKWNVKAVYDDLKKNAKSGGGEGDGDGAGEGNPSDGEGGRGENSDVHDWDSAEDMTEEEAKAIEKQVDNAIRQAALAGNIGANMPRSVQAMLVPSVDWKTLLSEFVKTKCAGLDKQTWRRPHKTYVAYDLYIPAPYSESLGRILIAGDTSGSIDDQMLSVFMGHMQCLVDEVSPSGVDIAWWGTKVVGVDSFERGAMDALANAVNPRGGGGTTPSCITDWIKHENKQEAYTCAVVITDGEFYGDSVGDWGDIPVLWLVVNSRPVPNISVGTTIHVEELA